MEQLRNNERMYNIDEGPTWFIVYPLPSTRGGVFGLFENNVLERIDGNIEFYYSIGTLVEQFGNPERLYIVSKGGTGCSSCDEWEPPTAPVMNSPIHLLYPSQGLWFLMLVPMSGPGCICPEMKVTAFCYYPPVSMQEALSNNYLAGLCTSVLDGITEQDMSEWHGFGGGY
ncbi:MAG: hypothetical protein GY832_22355 [Chloroflexi bacterium]|nr:hypothetical protein [Chloroflexota bacterium]